MDSFGAQRKQEAASGAALFFSKAARTRCQFRTARSLAGDRTSPPELEAGDAVVRWSSLTLTRPEFEGLNSLGPPARCPFADPFLEEGSPTKIDYRKKGYPCSNLSTGGPSSFIQCRKGDNLGQHEIVACDVGSDSFLADQCTWILANCAELCLNPLTETWRA